MNVLEQEIIAIFQQLELDAQQRVLQSLTISVQSSIDYATWWEEVDALQADIRARLGNTATVGTLSLLDELREEAS